MQFKGWWLEARFLPSFCFLTQETLLHTVSIHPGVLAGLILD